MEVGIWINKTAQNPPDIGIFQLIKNLKVFLRFCRISKWPRHNSKAKQYFFLGLGNITILHYTNQKISNSSHHFFPWMSTLPVISKWTFIHAIFTNLVHLPKRQVPLHLLLQPSKVKRSQNENQCTICYLLIVGLEVHTNSLKVLALKNTYLCFCSRIFSRALSSTLSNVEKTLSKCLTLSFTGNSDGKSDPQRIDSIISDLQIII